MVSSNLGRFALGSALAILLAACSRSEEEHTRNTQPAAEVENGIAIPAHAQSTVYQCAGNNSFTLHVLPDTAWVKLPNRTVRLPRDTDYKGTRYSNGSIDFTLNDPNSRLETEEMTYSGCKATN